MSISLTACLLGGFLSFFSIACKSINQKSVQYNRYWLIPPISYLQAFTELFTAGIFAKTYIDHSFIDCSVLAFCIGTGAWIGCVSGIRIQAMLVKKLYKTETKV